MNEPLALILIPTRELGNQVFVRPNRYRKVFYNASETFICVLLFQNVAQTFGKSLGINVKLLEGGHIGNKIKNPPSVPIDLMVSTVNVVTELSKVEVYSMRKLKTIILDEADTLTDDSFCENVLTFLQPFSVNNAKHLFSIIYPAIQRTLNWCLST